MKSCPPQTPHGSRRSRAPSRQSERTGQSMHRALAYSTSLGDSANHSSGSYTRHGSPASSTLPASSWRLPRLGWSAVLVRSRTLTVMFFTSSAHLDRGCCSSSGLWWDLRPWLSGFEKQKGRGSLVGFRGLEAADQLLSTGRWTPGTGPRDVAGNEAHVALAGGQVLAHERGRGEAGEGHVGGVAANGRAEVRRDKRRHLVRVDLHDHTSFGSSGAGIVSPDVRTTSIGTVKVPLRRGKEQLI